MAKRMKYRLSALLLAFGLVLSLAAPAAYAVQADGDTIMISTAAELEAFAGNCSLDTWSQGKTVILTADLDLMGAEFTPIPTFGGTFLGQGHTISGLRITAAGSTQGLFRYIQPSGVVQDLRVEGTVAPGGTRSTVGGIVGNNSGILQNCSFHGTIQGDTAVGGIAGRNSVGGQIIECTVSGAVSGENATGGVAGYSLGLLMKCTNNAGVNLTQTESSVDLMDPDAGAALEERANADAETYYLLNGRFDTGGIVGWSSGVVQSCTNTGAVGYPHVGYNTGGIAGRQSGYLSGCVNSGTINGRKDVGGIVGQGEPYLAIVPREDALEQLEGELDVLDALIDRALNNTQRTGNDVTARLEAMGSFTDSARDSSQQMLDHISGFTDENIGAINTLTADLTNALNKITPALDDLSDIGRQIEVLSGQLGEAMDTLNSAVDIGNQAMYQLRIAVRDLQQAGHELTAAADSVKTALDNLLGKAIRGTAGEQAAALNQLKDSIAVLGGVFSDISAAIDELRRALEEGAPLPDVDTDGILDFLGKASGALLDMFRALTQLKELLPTLEDIKNAHENMNRALDALAGAGSDLDTALSGIQDALGNSGPLSGKLNQALDRLQSVSNSSAQIGTLLRRACNTVSNAVKELSAQSPEFTPLGEDFRQESDGLYGALAGLSGEMDGLNGVMQAGGSTLTADLQAINGQFRIVVNVLLDAMSDLKNAPDDGLDAVVQDTSEEDITATRDGKVADCCNNGIVEGDRNVGGVIGAVAIEFDFDPEDDASGVFTFGSIYETKAVLQGCVNYGSVTAKKDCVGGLAGRMDLGTALDCQNYGPVESTGGDYVGGIAGFADASVRGCWSKSGLSGRNYVGGIAGWASRLWDCRAIAVIAQGTECLGAIAGGVETGGVLSGCYFVDIGTAGVDGVSYAGQAEPMAFESIAQLEDVPAGFTAFTLTLTADSKIVAQIPFFYGDDLSRIQLPEVPEKEGSYGVWPEFDVSGTRSDITLEAEYAPWITLAASQERSGQLSLALAEGQFTDEAVLHVVDSTRTPPKQNAEGAVTWDVSLTGSGLGEEDMLPLRLLNPSSGDTDVWQYRNGQWVAVDTQRSGQYLLFTIEGTQGTFFLQPREDEVWNTVLPIAVGAAGLAALLLLAGKLRKRNTDSLSTIFHK